MERKLTKLANSTIEVEVTLNKEEWKKEKEAALKKLAAQINIPGFRKGKAPIDMVKKKVKDGEIVSEAVNIALPKIYRNILDNEDIHPLNEPKVDVTNISEDELKVKFTIEVTPEIELKNYKGYQIGKENVEVNEEEVKKAILDLLASNATLVEKDGESEKGDTVIIDFKGRVDGKEFEGGSAENYELELGSNSFIPGFEDQLLKHKKGDHVEVSVKFPEQYVPELAGKDAIFSCDIHEIKQKKNPELTDEFVKELALKGVENVEALHKHKKEELLKHKKAKAKNNYINKVIAKIASEHEINLPESIVNNAIKQNRENIEQRMAQSGLNLEQYLSIMGQKKEEFEKKLREDTVNNLKAFLIMSAIIKKEKIVVTEEEIEKEYQNLAKENNLDIAKVKEYLSKQKDDFIQNLILRKAEDFIYNENN